MGSQFCFKDWHQEESEVGPYFGDFRGEAAKAKFFRSLDFMIHAGVPRVHLQVHHQVRCSQPLPISLFREVPASLNFDLT